MGAAAVNRGDKHIRQQIADEYAASGAPARAERRAHRENEQITALRAELAAARAELAQARMSHELRIAERDLERVERTAEREAAARDYAALREMWQNERRAANEYQSAHRKASAILRCLPVDLVTEAHADARMYYPELPWNPV